MKKRNREKAERGAYIIGCYAMKYGADESNLRDILSDLMHLCDADKVNFGREVDLARDNYEAEK